MKAVRLTEFGGPEGFRVEEVPDPVPGAGEVLVRIRASGLNPVDSYVREGAMRPYIATEMPAILGCDGAGTVEALGDGVTAFAVGDRVVVHKAPMGRGTHADLTVAPGIGVARLPDSLTFEEGATLPLAAITGRELVAALGDLRAGTRVLVSGALGAVGRVVVQALIEAGAVPVAGVRAERLDEGRELAGEAVDVAAPRAGAFDRVVIAAAPVAAEAAAWLTPDGRGATAVPVPEEAAKGRVTLVMAHDDGPMLQAAVDAAGRGDLSIPVAATFALDDLADAHRALDAHPSGKIIIRH